MTTALRSRPRSRASRSSTMSSGRTSRKRCSSCSCRCPKSLIDQLIDRYDALALERSQFFAAEGVAAILTADDRAREGLLAAEAAGSYRARDPLAPPTFVITAEHYDRVARLVEQKQPVRVGSISRPRLRQRRRRRQHRRRDSWRREQGRGRDARRALRFVALGHRRDRQRRRQRGDDRGDAHPQDARPEAGSHGPPRAVERRRAGPAGSRAYVKEHFADPDDDGAEAGARQAVGVLQSGQRQRARSAASTCRATRRCGRSSSSGSRRFAISA